MDEEELRGDPRTYAIIGAAMEVHKELGPRFLESVYQAALEVELTARGVPLQAQVPVPVFYKGNPLPSAFRADLVCYGNLLVELKASVSTGRTETAQVVNYLKATRRTVGLLLNFGSTSLQFQRVIHVTGWRPSERI